MDGFREKISIEHIIRPVLDKIIYEFGFENFQKVKPEKFLAHTF